VNYDVDGLWLDVPNYATFSTDPWTQASFRKQYGKTAEESTPGERRRFAADSLVNWTQEVASYVRKTKPSVVVTYNGASDPVSSGPRLAIGMAGAVDYFSMELHADEDQQENVAKLKGRLMAHIVDDLSWHGGVMARYRPQYVHLRLNEGLVPFQKATVVPENQSLPISTDGAWKVLELYPNVEIMVLLEGKI
jgi:hypothetical protein